MKTTKKIMASALALTMAASAGIGALADSEPIKTSGGTATVPVTISSAYTSTTTETDPVTGETKEVPVYDAPVFSVTVPASLPLTINANGSVEVPTNLKIENGSAGPVKVTNVEFKSGETWKFEAFGSNFDEMQVNAHKLGLSLTANSKTVKSGDTGNDLKPDWTIAKGASLGITAAAKASAVSATVTENNAASVIFTVGWNAAATEGTGGSENGDVIETFSFTIYGSDSSTSCTVKAGDNWLQWLASDYNTQTDWYLAYKSGAPVLTPNSERAGLELDTVARPTEYYYTLPDGAAMTDVIKNGETYNLKGDIMAHPDTSGHEGNTAP